MVRWQVRKARYPTDPNKAWLAIPGRSIMRASRFPTWAEAWAFAISRSKR